MTNQNNIFSKIPSTTKGNSPEDIIKYYTEQAALEETHYQYIQTLINKNVKVNTKINKHITNAIEIKKMEEEFIKELYKIYIPNGILEDDEDDEDYTIDIKLESLLADNTEYLEMIEDEE